MKNQALIKEETLAQVFSCEFCEIFKDTFFIEHLRLRLLITISPVRDFKDRLDSPK